MLMTHAYSASRAAPSSHTCSHTQLQQQEPHAQVWTLLRSTQAMPVMQGRQLFLLQAAPRQQQRITGAEVPRLSGHVLLSYSCQAGRA